MNKCFACGRKLGKFPTLVDTRDDQIVYVGSECIKKIHATGEQGYPLNGTALRLYARILPENLEKYYQRCVENRKHA